MELTDEEKRLACSTRINPAHLFLDCFHYDFNEVWTERGVVKPFIMEIADYQAERTWERAKAYYEK